MKIRFCLNLSKDLIALTLLSCGVSIGALNTPVRTLTGPIGNAVVIENPAFDMTDCGPVSASAPDGPQVCKSKFLESLSSTSGALGKLQAVYLDMGGVDFDTSIDQAAPFYSATCGHPATLDAFAPSYSNLATGESDLCQDLGTMIRSYAQYGLKTYLWVSYAAQYPLENGAGSLSAGVSLTDIQINMRKGVENLLTDYAPNNTLGNPVLSGIAFENSAIFQNSTNSGLTSIAPDFYEGYDTTDATGKRTHHQGVIDVATQNHQMILIYEPPKNNEIMDQDLRFVRLIPLYDLSDSHQSTGWTTDSSNPLSTYSPELLSDYTQSVTSQIQGHATAYPQNPPYQYMLPASGQDSVWTELQGYGTPVPAVPASVQQSLSTNSYQYQDVSSCTTGQSGSNCNAYVYTPNGVSETGDTPQLNYLNAAMAQVTPFVASDSSYQGTVLYNVRPPYFWLGLAAKTKGGCSANHVVGTCFGTLPDSIEPNEVLVL